MFNNNYQQFFFVYSAISVLLQHTIIYHIIVNCACNVIFANVITCAGRVITCDQGDLPPMSGNCVRGVFSTCNYNYNYI